MEHTKQRDSGLELLRIVCMLLIIAHHYSVHGDFTTQALAAYPWQGMFVQMLSMFGRAACSIFALITGFFLVERTGERHLRRIVPLLAEQFFYSALILAVVWAARLRPVSVFDAVRSLVPVVWGNWYVVAYIMVYLLAPFLNPWLRSMEKAVYRRLLAVVFLLWSVIPTLTTMDWAFSELDFFLVMYLAGGYIRLHVDGKTRYANRWNLAVCLGSAGVMLLSVAVANTLGRRLPMEFLVQNATYFQAIQSVPAVVFALSAFLYFSRLRFSNRVVNGLAGSMVGVYLIHDHELVRDLLWKHFSPNAAHLADPWLHAPVKILGVFAVCVLVDLLRRATVERVFLKWFRGACAAWDRKHASADGLAAGRE